MSRVFDDGGKDKKELVQFFSFLALAAVIFIGVGSWLYANAAQIKQALLGLLQMFLPI